MPKHKLKPGLGLSYNGNLIWLKVYYHGKIHRLSTKTDDPDKAIAFRQDYLVKLSEGDLPTTAAKQVTVGQILDAYLEYAVRELKSGTIIRGVISTKIRSWFAEIRAHQLSTADLKRYRQHVEKHDSPVTANRHLSYVRAAFYYAKDKISPPLFSGEVPNFPIYAKLEKTNARQGYLKDDQYQAMRDALPDHLKALFVMGYWVGVRKGELCAIHVDQVDIERCEIILGRQQTKNGTARKLTIFDGDMLETLMWQLERHERLCPDFPFLLFNEDANGPIIQFAKAWKTSCCKVEGLHRVLPDQTKEATLHFHDLRRTAVRNMRRMGIDRSLIKIIIGHKTDSMFERYNIVDTDEIHHVREVVNAKSKHDPRAEALSKLSRLSVEQLNALLKQV